MSFDVSCGCDSKLRRLDITQKFYKIYSSRSFKVTELDLEMTDRQSGMNLFQIKTSDLDQALSIE